MSDAQSPIIELTGNTQSIEDNHIAPGTRDTYNQHSVCFIHYLYNHHDHLLVYKDALDQADARYKAVKSSRSNDKKRKIRRKGQQTNFTNECKLQLNRMPRNEKNCPVVDTGENCLDYSVIRNYVNTKSKVVEVDKKLAELATWVRSKRKQGRGEGYVIGKEEGGANNGENAFMGRENVQEQEYGNGDAAEVDVEVTVRCSKSVYTGIGSAIYFLYRQYGIERPAKLKDSISQYCKSQNVAGQL